MNLKMTKPKFAAIAAIAFISGVAFASSMDWTKILSAQSKSNGSKPLSAAVQTLADQGNAFVAIAEHVTPAVVSITAQRDPRPADARRQRQVPPGMQGFEELFQDPRQQGPQESSGTGFIVTGEGYILTNNHVVEGADRVKVALSDRRTFTAKIIGRDPQTDVAVLKIEGKDLPTISLGDDAKVRVGEWAVAVGNPLGLDFTVTAGIISAKGRSYELAQLNQNLYAIQDFIQTDAAINPGNSGGPLVNTRGEVIGINSAIASQTGTYTGYGFAIPITLAKTVMDDIIAHGRVRRAIMGASMGEVSAEDAAVNNLKDISGAKIQDLVIQTTVAGDRLESPAEKAGVERGDIVVAADGKKVDRVSALQRILRMKQPGDVVTLDVVRYGEKKSLKVKLTEAPSDDAKPAAVVAKAKPDEPSASLAISKLGITVEGTSAKLSETLPISDKLKGVAVVSVTPGSTSEGKLFPADVVTAIRFPNQVAVATVADLQRELGKLKVGQYVGLMVYSTNPQNGATNSRVVNLRIAE